MCVLCGRPIKRSYVELTEHGMAIDGPIIVCASTVECRKRRQEALRPKRTRSEQNRINRTTRGGITKHPNYSVCRGVRRDREVLICAEWDDEATMIEELTAEIGNRRSRDFVLAAKDWNRPLGPGNIMWQYKEHRDTKRLLQELRSKLRINGLLGRVDSEPTSCVCWLRDEPVICNYKSMCDLNGHDDCRCCAEFRTGAHDMSDDGSEEGWGVNSQ